MTYRIAPPALISFSGGRTSGYMLWQIIDAYGGKLPADVIPVFANTGKERDETLDFVQNCATHWGVSIRWVEWRDDTTGFAEVGHNSAARNGEPFTALIAKKKAVPDWQMRFCTQYLKVKAMITFFASLGFEPGTYREAIGLRYDEGKRILRMLEQNDKHSRQCVAPMSKGRVVLRDVTDFWRQQPFDLGIQPGEGNCDLCFLKGRGLKKELIRRRPASATWWIEQERLTDAWFDRRDSVSGLAEEVRQAPDLFGEIPDEEYDVECGLVCATD